MILTQPQHRTLDAYATTGTQKAAAVALGITERQVRRRMQAMRDANGATNMQLARHLGRLDVFEQLGLWEVAA